jgi:hypothetical protein
VSWQRADALQAIALSGVMHSSHNPWYRKRGHSNPARQHLPGSDCVFGQHHLPSSVVGPGQPSQRTSSGPTIPPISIQARTYSAMLQSALRFDKSF